MLVASALDSVGSSVSSPKVLPILFSVNQDCYSVVKSAPNYSHILFWRDYEKALGQGETLGYATGLAGEQARTAAIMEAGASGTLNALTGRRQAMTDAQKARVEFEKTLLPETPKAPEDFTLGEGQVRYGADGSVIASGLPKKPSLPASAQEYEYAVQNGYKGSFAQYQNEDANRRRSIVNVGSDGKETPSAQELKIFINKQMATPEFKALSDDEKEAYIRSQGGTPYDFL